MRNLLSAGVYRMLRHPVYLAALTVLAVAGGILCGTELYYGMDDVYLFPMLFSFGATVALAWGREHGDGTVRNKAIAGHGRGMIFLSETVLHMIVCCVLTVCFLAALLIAGHDVIVRIPAVIVAEACLCFLLAAIGMGALLSAVCALIFNRAVCAIVGVLLVLGLQFATYEVQDILNQPPFYTVWHADESGEAEWIEEKPNKMYVVEPWRSLLIGLDCANPFAQMSRASMVLNLYAYSLGEGTETAFEWDDQDKRQVEILHTLPLYAVLLTGATTAVGVVCFRRKDLK